MKPTWIESPTKKAARWRAHVAAAAMYDFTFWVRTTEDGKWEAIEVETGISGEPADTPREAL